MHQQVRVPAQRHERAAAANAPGFDPIAMLRRARAPFGANVGLVALCAGSSGGCILEGDGFDAEEDTGSELAGDIAADAPSYVMVSARFAVDGEGFYRLPWPNDLRMTEEGMVDLSDFPDPGVELLRSYVAAVEANLRGFSLMPVVYFALDADPIETWVLEPALSLTPEGPAQLIEVSADGCGSRIPLEVKVNHDVDDTIEDNVLVASPVPGFILKPSTTYALILRRTLGNRNGFGLSPAAESQAAFLGTHPNARLNAIYAPAAACLPRAGVELNDIAVATVFTTQDPVTELRALRDFVASEATPTPNITSFEFSDAESRAGYDVYLGTYDTPMFQDGVSPYQVTGGAIHFEADGDPILQGTEEVPFAVVTPTAGTPPYRLLLWVDGTGADQTSWIRSSVTQAMLAAGFAVANYVPQFHGQRATLGSNTELHSFNYLNPNAFRNTFRQQVADTSYFLRVMTEARDQMSGLAAIDATRVVYGGQSQGSLVGAMVAGVEPNIQAYMLNGVASYLSTVAVERKDPFDIQALISDLTGISPNFDRFHPLMAMAQMGGDATDPQSFAPYWRGWDRNPGGADILLVNGLDDYTSAVDSMNALSIAGDLAPIDPPGWDIDPFDVWDGTSETLPIANNRLSVGGDPVTHAVLMSATTGHFTIYDRGDARALAIEFLRTAALGEAIVE